MTVDSDADPGRRDALTAHLSEEGDLTIVKMAGELDMATVHLADAVLDEAVDSGKPIVIDMTGLTFFSSAGLNLLARLEAQRRSRSLTVCLVADQRTVVLPLRLAGLHDLFPLHTTLDDAVEAVRHIDRSG